MLKRLVCYVLMLLTISGMSAEENNGVPTPESSYTTNVNHRPAESISRNIFVEFAGPSFGVGIGYDQRFRPNTVFGFRTGLAYTNGSWSDSDGHMDGGSYTFVDFNGVTFPLEVNAIMGKRASKFELGVGATPCILYRYETSHWGCDPVYSGTEIKKGVRLNILGTLNIGYRLQRKSGFFLRAGITFLIGNLNSSPIDNLLCFPNLSLGYTIR